MDGDQMTLSMSIFRILSERSNPFVMNINIGIPIDMKLGCVFALSVVLCLKQ